MFRTQLLLPVLLPVLLAAALAPVPTLAAAFATPEQAIATYIEGVAAGDLGQVLATTAIEEMRDGFDFIAYVDRLQALTVNLPAPGGDAFFDEINATYFTATIAAQVKLLAYGLMTEAAVLDGRAEQMDGEGAATFAARLDTSRLKRLTLEAIGLPSPALMAAERYIANARKQAETYGADELTERVALLSFEGLHYSIGFTLLRYGDSWMISSQSSPLAGSSNFGAPTPTTPEEFRAATQ